MESKFLQNQAYLYTTEMRMFVEINLEIYARK